MKDTKRLPNTITEEDAINHINSWLQQNRHREFDLAKIIEEYLKEDARTHNQSTYANYTRMAYIIYDRETNSEPFYDAAWILCNRGILRPTPLRLTEVNQNRTDYSLKLLSNRFSVTRYGTEWIDNFSEYDCIPFEYGRFAELLSRHWSRFGKAYHSRSQEALRCYRSQNYLACCVMCGASAESILLALAIEKEGDSAIVLHNYNSRSGRSNVENKLFGQEKRHIQDEYYKFTILLKYWRDDAAHGAISEIGEEEAFTSLTLLLRFAHFSETNWDRITS